MKIITALALFILVSGLPSHAQPPRPDAKLAAVVQLLNFPEQARVRIDRDTVLQSTELYEIHSIVLKNRYGGRILLRLRIPKAPGRHPALFLAHGLNNEDSPFIFQNVKEDVVLAELEYPYNGEDRGLQLITDVVRSSWKCELQLAIALAWLQNQAYVAPNRISVVSVSLGTFLTPLAIRFAQTLGFQAYATVFAFGGADLMPLIHEEFQMFGSETDYKNVKGAISQALQWAEPAQHLPYLKGRFLVINGSEDQVIPVAAKNELFTGLPDPKQVVELDTPHISPSRPQVIEQTIAVIRQWLSASGALKVPGPVSLSIPH